MKGLERVLAVAMVSVGLIHRGNRYERCLLGLRIKEKAYFSGVVQRSCDLFLAQSNSLVFFLLFLTIVSFKLKGLEELEKCWITI